MHRSEYLGIGLRALHVLHLLLVSQLLLQQPGTAVSPANQPNQYFCIENYIPIGDPIRNISVGNSSSVAHLTSGHTARRCSTACDAEPLCTAFRAVGADAVGGPSCQLLANSTARLSSALAEPPGADWPTVLSNITAADGIGLRSLAWLCFKGEAAWDAFGAATHALIHTGHADPNIQGLDHQQWCAMGTDVAGSNLQQFTNIQHPVDCDVLCVNASSCVFWTFVASKPDTGLASFNCFVRADPFKGQNGWTGPPKHDIWVPDSEMECFKDNRDWMQLGRTLSPAIQTTSLDGKYYTVFPERVTWAQANASCNQLPNGRLAVLDNNQALNTAYRDLLTTLASQTAIISAWVGAKGNNPGADSTSIPTSTGTTAPPAGSPPGSLPQPVAHPNQPGPETTLRWLNGRKVAASELRRLVGLSSVWSAHDVIWTQQFVPSSHRDVCGRLLSQIPSPQQPPEDPSSVLPGVWYFDCLKPAGFICESSAPPNEPMVGRSTMIDYKSQAAWENSNSNIAVWKIAVATLVPTLAVLLLSWQWMRFHSSRSSRRLPDLLLQQRKRLLGPPRGGNVAVVVTDIQDFTRLTQETPEQMVQALMIHNQVIKQAAYDHVGYVLMQEGDSFTLAFHEPEDAVEFALQVQQALLEHPWPPDIQYHDAWQAPADTPADPVTTSSQQQHLPQSPGAAAVAAAADSGPDSPSQLQHQDSQPRRTSADGSSPPRLSQRPSLDQRLMHWLSSSINVTWPAAAAGSRTSHRESDGSPPSPPAPQDSRASTTNDRQPVSGQVAAEGGVRRSYEGMPHNSFVTGPRTDAVSTISPFSSASLAAALHRNAWLQQLLAPRLQGTQQAAGAGGQQQQSQLFMGLRVRVGVATGFVSKGQEMCRSAVYRTAQDVSAAAAGGQVLMDETTFTAVKEAMRRLGLVTASGLDYDQLYASTRRSSGSGGSATNLLPYCFHKQVKRPGSTVQASPAEYAIAFDMGCFEMVSEPARQLHDAAADGQQSSSSCPLWGAELGSRLLESYQLYLQELMLHQPAGSSLQDELSIGMPDGGYSSEHDLEQPYMLASYLRSESAARDTAGLPDPQQQQQQQQLQQQQQQGSPRQGMQAAKGLRARLQQLTDGLLGLGIAGNYLQGNGSPQASIHDWQQRGDPATHPSGYPAKQTQLRPTSVSSGLESTVDIWDIFPPTIRLYQVVAPVLAGRAALFGSKLALPKHWRCIDAPYFSAPGLSSNSSTALAATAASTVATACGGQGQGPQPGYQWAVALSPAAAAAGQSGAGQVWPKASPFASAAAVSDAGPQPPQRMLAQAPSGDTTTAPGQTGEAGQAGAVVAALNDMANVSSSTAPASLLAGPTGEVVRNSAGSAATHSSSGRFTRDQASLAAWPGTAAAAANAAATYGAVPAARSHAVKQSSKHFRRSQDGSAASTLSLLPSRAPWQAQRVVSGKVTDAAAAGSGSVAAGTRGSTAVLLRPVYPAVTVVFTSVEGAQQLAGHPDLARCVHRLLHRLMLQLLSRHFPGSYLIRAQEGELRYLAAFNTPTAAAAWCLTLQEAALYAPYPNELLGFSNFGVQLDSSSRLVFRGPRLKAGFSEGVPNCILPDHMGRADYSGSFVNGAARFTDAAAHGGHVVTDAELASRVLREWQQNSNTSGTASRRRLPAKAAPKPALQPALQPALLEPFSCSPQGASSALQDTCHTANGTSGGISSESNQRAAATELKTVHSMPASLSTLLPPQSQNKAVPAAFSSAAVGAPPPSSDGSAAPPPVQTGGACPSSDHAAVSASSGVVGSSSSGFTAVPVDFSWLGSFLFKGSPRPTDMVAMCPRVLLGRSFPDTTPAGKGLRVAQRVGAMGTATVQLPAAVEGFRV